jgi:hypothetical protein
LRQGLPLPAPNAPQYCEGFVQTAGGLAFGHQFFFFQFGHDARQREGLRFDEGDGAFLCFKEKFAPAQAGQRVELVATALRPRGIEAVT